MKIVHGAGRLFLLHFCGNVGTIMDELMNLLARGSEEQARGSFGQV